MAAHFGRWLRTQIGKRGEKQTEFAARSGIPRPTILEWIRWPAPRILPDRLKLLADSLEMSYDDLEKELAEAQGIAEPDRNIEIGSMVSLVTIPLFDRDLAAGRWTQAVFVDESEVTQPQLEQGLFRVRLSGDSMVPKYKDGAIVEFRVIVVCREGLVEGGDYYIQRDDEMATFKRVDKLSEETVILRALNRKKYPEPMVVDRSRIVRCAKAVAIIHPLI